MNSIASPPAVPPPALRVLPAQAGIQHAPPHRGTGRPEPRPL